MKVIKRKGLFFIDEQPTALVEVPLYGACLICRLWQGVDMPHLQWLKQTGDSSLGSSVVWLRCRLVS